MAAAGVVHPVGRLDSATVPEPTGTLDTVYAPALDVVTAVSALWPAGVTVTLVPDMPPPALLVTVPDTAPVCGLPVGEDDPPPHDMMTSRNPSDGRTRNDMGVGIEVAAGHVGIANPFQTRTQPRPFGRRRYRTFTV